MPAMIDIDKIFLEDREHPPSDRTLPWTETRDGITVVVEPKPHWAEDMRVFLLDAREYCRYAEWTAHGARARCCSPQKPGHFSRCCMGRDELAG